MKTKSRLGICCLRCSLTILALLAVSELLAKDKWIFGSVGNFTVYSNTSERQTLRVINDLREVKAIIAQRFPLLISRNSMPLRVFICKNNAAMRRFVPLDDGEPRTLSGMYTLDFEGDLILVNGGKEIDQVRKSVYHEYIHAIHSGGDMYLPTWLSEGLAVLYSTIRISESKAEIGRADMWNVSNLRNRKLIPLERLFWIGRLSPEYNSIQHGRSIFYSQSWALLHFLMFGEAGLPEGAFEKFISSAISEPIVTEDTFREITGFSFDETEKHLKQRADAGYYQTITLEKPTLPSDETLTLSPATEGETDLIAGMLLLATRDPEEAYAPLEYAYRKLPSSPEAAAYRGFYLCKQGLFDAATDFFEEAIERDSESASTYLYHAASILRKENPGSKIGSRIFDREETARLLKSLSKARELGDSRAELYRSIGEVWLNSAVTAGEVDIGVVMEGFRMHPDDEVLGYFLARLLFKIKNYDTARTVIECFLERETAGLFKRRFLDLEDQINSFSP